MRIPARFRAFVESLSFDVVIAVLWDMTLRLIGGDGRREEEAMKEIRNTVRLVRRGK